MYNNQPIGLFDSGIGGVSIWRAINHLLPNEQTIYLADSKNSPYGDKSKDEILSFCIKNTNFLLEMNCKLVVVACNTATTNAIKELRQKYKVPFIGIEPAIKPAAINSKTRTIGILATKGTLNSELFFKAVKTYKDTKIVEQIGYDLVQLIENGEMNSAEMTRLLQLYLTPMIAQNIDMLVLGCTHYPFLISQIKKILPPSVQIIDSGEAVARQTKKILEETVGYSTLKEINPLFYINSDSRVLKELLENKYKVEQCDF